MGGVTDILRSPLSEGRGIHKLRAERECSEQCYSAFRNHSVLVEKTKTTIQQKKDNNVERRSGKNERLGEELQMDEGQTKGRRKISLCHDDVTIYALSDRV